MPVNGNRPFAKYVVHVRKQKYDEFIGRGSIWGNPFTHHNLENTKAQYQVPDRKTAILCFRHWIVLQPELVAQLSSLKGKTLGCYCAPLECHGEVLMEIAYMTSKELEAAQEAAKLFWRDWALGKFTNKHP